MSQAHPIGETASIGIGSGAAGSAEKTSFDLDLSGRQLGDYRLLRRLGRGAMADVYLAEQGSLRRQVAFKALKRELANDHTYVRRFHMEAQAAASLVQANIVQIYEVGCIEGCHYIAQEYVEGQNLSQYISRNGAPPVKLSLALMRQVAAALCKAADRGIVHRDIKPENIMMARSGEVKVADFGLARIGTGEEESLKLTQVGITMGTPLYMSPEQVEGRQLDPRSDIYSLGVTCYHMLAGQPPFRGDTALSVAIQHVRTQPERLENIRPDLPPALCRIIHKMLAKDTAQRQQGPRELLHELRALQIEGIDMQWPAELDELSTVESVALAQASWAATQRLQTVMNSHAMLQNDRRWLWYAAAGSLVALFVGASAAWALHGSFLLEVPASQVPKVQLQGSPADQYWAAQSLGTEAAWESIINNPGNFGDRLYVPMAEVELALKYLKTFDQGDRDKALHLFEHLAKDYPNDDVQWRADGLAGQAIVLSLDGNYQESLAKILELDKFLNTIPNATTGRQTYNPRYFNSDILRDLRSVIAINDKKLGDAATKATKDFQQKLDTLMEEPGS
ncbi:MAG TPA: serine/threonine-protein kinase [Pirellulales bacterium]|jgi:serine/threonine-protein kinase|nr:serine/threonine-protein kinase [Pirellulales bacterium]